MLYFLANNIQKKLSIPSSETKLLQGQSFSSNVCHFIDIIEVFFLKSTDMSGKATLDMLVVKLLKEVGNQRVKAFEILIWWVTRWHFILQIA